MQPNRSEKFNCATGRRTLWFALAASAAVVAVPVRAQEASAGLEDIVVTARKVAENSQKVPITITAFSGSSLETKSVTQILNVATFTPGFNVQPVSNNATAFSMTLRGQVQNDIIATLEPTVGVYVDEMYWGKSYGLNAGLIDIANVQVLKGPQGTLFGRNTTGGALLVTSNDPDFSDLSGRVSATYGRFNEATGDIILNVPVNDRVALRGAFHVSQRDGWAYGTRLVNAAGLPDNSINPGSRVVSTGRRYNDRKELLGRLKALVRVTDTTDLMLSGEWFDFTSDGTVRQMIYRVPTAPVTDFTANKYIAYYRDHPNAAGAGMHDCSFAVTQTLNCSDKLIPAAGLQSTTATQTYLARLTQEVGFGQLKFIGGYRKVSSTNANDLDGSGTVLHSTAYRQDLDQWSFEAQANGTAFDDRLKFATGVTYLTEGGDDLSLSLNNTAGDRLGGVAGCPSGSFCAARTYAIIDNKSVGVYGQASFRLLDRLSVTGGLRYSHDDKGVDIRSASVLGTTGQVINCSPAVTTLPGATVANDCSYKLDRKFSALSWLAGLDYQVTDAVLVYGKFNRGYRAGGHNLRAFKLEDAQPFNPEFANDIEVGLKADLFDRHVRFNLAAYRTIVTAAQRSVVQTLNGITQTLIKNAAKVRIMGAEGELTVNPLEGLTLSAGASYVQNKYLDYTLVGSLGPEDHSSEEFPFVSPGKITLSGQYAFELNERLGAQLSVDYSWESSKHADECIALSTPTAPSCWTTTAGPRGGFTAQQISQAAHDANRIPAANILNARFTIDVEKKYQFSVWGRNLLNDRGFNHIHYIDASNRNYVSGSRREPLTYGVTASASF